MWSSQTLSNSTSMLCFLHTHDSVRLTQFRQIEFEFRGITFNFLSNENTKKLNKIQMTVFSSVNSYFLAIK